MESLRQIPGIEEASLELLEAAGFRDCESLARAGVEPLVLEMERANRILQITDCAPTREQIDHWIRSARCLVGEDDMMTVPEPVMPTNFEVVPDVISMLEHAPCAIPFPGRWLSESNIKVGEIVPGILLNRCAGDLEVRIDDRLPAPHGVPKPTSNQYVRIAENKTAGRLEIDVAKLRTVEQVAAMPRPRRRSASGQQPVLPMNVEDALDLIEQSADGVGEQSERKLRRNIRGVLHSDPWAIRFGAFITLVLIALIPVAVVVSPLLLLSDRDPEAYHWVRPWWILFPFLLPLISFFWLVWAFPCSCRVCRQKLFVPKKHRKNARAHHFPLLGYIVPLIFHMLLFQWFRCTHCGTPVRLRK